MSPCTHPSMHAHLGHQLLQVGTRMAKVGMANHPLVLLGFIQSCRADFCRRRHLHATTQKAAWGELVSKSSMHADLVQGTCSQAWQLIRALYKCYWHPVGSIWRCGRCCRQADKLRQCLRFTGWEGPHSCMLVQSRLGVCRKGKGRYLMPALHQGTVGTLRQCSRTGNA
jgi:hypothetical protein